MAIAQERMIAVITAGLNFRAAYLNLVRKIYLLEQRLYDPKFDPTPPSEDLPLFKAELSTLVTSAAIPFPTVSEDTTTLQVQHIHFQRAFKINRNHREHMRRKRLLKGIAPKDQSRSLDTLLASMPDNTQHNSYLYPENLLNPPQNKPDLPPPTPDFQTIPNPSDSGDNSGDPPPPPTEDDKASWEWWEKEGQFLPKPKL